MSAIDCPAIPSAVRRLRRVPSICAVALAAGGPDAVAYCWGGNFLGLLA